MNLPSRARRIVWLQAPPWDGVWTRQNHFARRFVRDGANVLYVENPVAIRQRLKAEGGSLLEGGLRVRTVEPGLQVMSLPLQAPGGRGSELIGRINGARFGGAVRRWLAAQGWSEYTAWCRVPGSVDALAHLQPSAVIYDVTDDYELYARSGSERLLTARREARLARRADAVFTTTETLRQKLLALNPRVEVIPNGVDGSFFEPPMHENDPLSHVPHPRIGFVGLVARWMDFELLRKLGERWPGQVVVVGPTAAEAESVYRAIPGLVRVGHVPHLEVPRYLRAFDVCILPHELSELRHRADPLKIVEYLAAGKPTVSVDLRAVRPYAGLVDIAPDHQAFLDLVAQRLADPRADLAERRRVAAAARGWEGLYERVVETVAGLPEGRSATTNGAI